MLSHQSESVGHSERISDVLCDRSIAALRKTLQNQLSQPFQEDSLRRALRVVCFEARMKHMRPEDFKLVVRRVWFSLPEVALNDSAQYQQLLGRILDICVEEHNTA